MVLQKEFIRQFIHAITGTVIVILIHFDIFSTRTVFLLLITAILMSFICKHAQIPFISNIIEKFERDSVKKTFPGKGPIYFLAGSLLVLSLFPEKIALASILILSFGDSTSHLVGKRYGKLSNLFNKDGKKYFEGTLAGIVAGFLAALFFVPVSWALIGSFSAMATEAAEIAFNEKPLDDNILVPLMAGTAMYLMQLYI